MVVYKVDRLTRSLSDFAKLIDIFDKHKVSFVSVTQQFSTTSSIGRLTLNVLLSFAQFEREVTGERIRDKFTASRKKGLWMGGFPPIGYDIKERKLAINKKYAKVIKEIFEFYLEVKSFGKLTALLKEKGYKTRNYKSTTGRQWGGCAFSHGHLSELLQNQIYIGKAVHKDKVYEGEHEAIIPKVLWDKVQGLIEQNRASFRASKNIKHKALLQGLIYDDKGNRMSPSYGVRRGKRYFYYVSRALLEGRKAEAGSAPRIKAQELERIITTKTPINRIGKVIISKDEITIQSKEGDVVKIKYQSQICKGRVRFLDESGAELVHSTPDKTLVKALHKAWHWRQKLESGEVNSVQQIAKSEGITARYVYRLLRLTYLAPEIIESILEGNQPRRLTLERLQKPFALDWQKQTRRTELLEGNFIFVQKNFGAKGG